MCSYWAMHVIKDLMQQPHYQSISKVLFSVRSHFMYSFLHCTGKAFPECSVENIVFNIFFQVFCLESPGFLSVTINLIVLSLFIL